ncbi:MAG: DNA-binding response regulator [Candidatus Hydrogenedentota bacterium]|nr:MAG: DNA-binding response regulator [Candidatus Hydrogenedentota bacterium]
MSSKLKIGIAEDHHAFRESLTKLVASIPGVEVTLSVPDGEALLQFLPDTKCDVLLLDINMPKMNGFEVLYHLNELYPNIEVIVLTGHNLPEYREKAKELGVHIFISKDNLISDLLPLLVRKAESYT